MSDRAPVAIFAFNRPDHLQRTLSALADSPQAEQTSVRIHCDGPRGDGDTEAVAAVARLVERVAAEHRFGALEVRRSPRNRGLADSIIDGVSALLTESEQVIVLEDDIEIGPHFLPAMNRALQQMAERSDIWSLSGYSPPIKVPADYPHQAYLTGRGSSWGWATWRSRWSQMSWDRPRYAELARDRTFRSRLARGGLDLPIILDGYAAGRIDSWAVRWCAHQCELGALTAYPVQSLIRNLGLDGSGTNSPDSPQRAPAGAYAGSSGVDLADLPDRPDPRIARQFARSHLHPLRYHGSRMKQRVLSGLGGRR